MRAWRATLSIAAVAAALAATGCGGGNDSRELTVSAASSLTAAFNQYGDEFAGADARFSFAGSDVLAAQIQQGARPDVFASANTTYPDELHHAGLVGKPVVFARNRLVIAVPSDSDIHSVRDLVKPGVSIAMGSASVPIGEYTRQLLSGLGKTETAAILHNVGSDEPDVAGIVGKISQGAVDAGFTYVTDVDATHGELKAVALPARLQPSVAYAAAVVNGTGNPEAAHAFIQGLLRGPGAKALQQAGFEPPPK